MKDNIKQPIEELSVYRWWKHHKRLRYLKMFLVDFTIIIIVFIALWVAGFDSFKTSDLIFGILILFFFLTYGLYQLILLFKSFRWKIDCYWYGTVIDMLQTRLPNKRVKDSLIIADVGGKVMEGICLSQTYHRAKIGDSVILFTLGTDIVYCIHQNM